MICEICGKDISFYSSEGTINIEGAGLWERHVFCSDCIRDMTKVIEKEIEKKQEAYK